jgi:hypothetical protein
LPAGIAAQQAELIDAFDQFVPHHSHSLGQILLFLRFALKCVIGLRGAAGVLEIFSPLFPTGEPGISANGGQMWLLRVGLYELSRPKEQADDWIWIVDHTIQIGKAKCLVVVGVRRALLDMKRLDENASGALTHEELSVWAIELVETSDGPTVERQLNELSQKTGQVPRAVLSDCGADLTAGIAGFCATHPQTIALKDLPHFAANAIKRELSGDSQWTAFLADANQSKTRLRQTKFAFLLPPDLKTKARWMNLDPLITWSKKTLMFVNSPRPVPGASWEDEELEEKMGWIRRYQSSLQGWFEMLNVVGTSLSYIRKQGYHQHAREELQEILRPLVPPRDSPAQRVAASILDYVELQSRAIPEGEHLLGTSEALESLLGKAKQLQARQSKSGFTKMILGIAAGVTQLTVAGITAALSTIKVQNVKQWLDNRLEASVQGQRFHALHAPNNGTKMG